MTFKNHREIKEAEQKILSLLYLEQININILNESSQESLNEGFNNWLKEFGLNLKKEMGVLDYAISFTSGIGMIIIAALKGDKHKVKAIAKMYSKEELLDFLTKLDKITLGLVSAPLELISSLTGWDIVDAAHTASKNTKRVLNNIKTAIQNIKTASAKILDAPKQKIINTHLDNISLSMPV